MACDIFPGGNNRDLRKRFDLRGNSITSISALTRIALVALFVLACDYTPDPVFVPPRIQVIVA